MSDEDNYIKFLGTAGARFVVARQLRYSAGTYLQIDGCHLMLDPGPGTLLRCARCRPKIDATALDAVVLTHAHIDHSTDVNALLDAMATGDKGGGALFCPGDCLEGENAVILNYAKDLPERIERLEASSTYDIGGVTFHTSVQHVHSVETHGVKFEVGDRLVSFLVDTDYFEELADAYADSDVLVINLVRHHPVEHGNVQHLCVEEAKEIISAVKPEKAVLTHFGMTMLKAHPWEVAEQMSEELGIDVEAASDGKKLDL